MILTEVKIHNFRNIISAHLSLNPRFNVITGPNGGGKTSILEAIHMLSCGHSFRSREVAPIISHGQNTLNVFARSQEDGSISIQKSLSDATQIKLNNQFCSTTSQIAYALPCQVIYSDVFQIIDAGPSVRRGLLDWGLFHVKHDYFRLWKEYKRVLKQRNALLRSCALYKHFIPWDQQLNQLANDLDSLRNEYFIQWRDQFYQLITELAKISCSIEYYKGWDKRNTGKELQVILEESFESDRNKLYTQNGPHQADLFLNGDQFKIKHSLSRGQQKMILIALKLAQGQLLDNDCLYLFDDFCAELDTVHQTKLLEYFNYHRGQFVITNLQNIGMDNVYPLNSINLYEINNGTLYGSFK